MIVKFLGILDIIAGLVLLAFRFGFGKTLVLIFSIYLIIKAVIFFKDPGSWIDAIAAAFMIIAYFGNYYFFVWIFSLWLIGKGVYSLIG